MNSVLQTAIRLLARREHTASDLTRKLLHRGYTRLAIEEAIVYCQTHHLQSDARAAASLYRTRVSQGYGKFKIEQDLKKWGIAPDIIANVFIEEPVDWLELASSILKKHAWRFATSHKQDAKPYQFLLSRGFPIDVIQAVLRENPIYEDR